MSAQQIRHPLVHDQLDSLRSSTVSEPWRLFSVLGDIDITLGSPIYKFTPLEFMQCNDKTFPGSCGDRLHIKTMELIVYERELRTVIRFTNRLAISGLVDGKVPARGFIFSQHNGDWRISYQAGDRILSWHRIYHPPTNEAGYLIHHPTIVSFKRSYAPIGSRPFDRPQSNTASQLIITAESIPASPSLMPAPTMNGANIPRSGQQARTTYTALARAVRHGDRRADQQPNRCHPFIKPEPSTEGLNNVDNEMKNSCVQPGNPLASAPAAGPTPAANTKYVAVTASPPLFAPRTPAGPGGGTGPAPPGQPYTPSSSAVSTFLALNTGTTRLTPDSLTILAQLRQSLRLVEKYQQPEECVLEGSREACKEIYAAGLSLGLNMSVGDLARFRGALG